MGGKGEDDKKWYHAARNGSWDALTAILISILPNLEEIHFVGYGNQTSYPFPGAVLERVRHFQDTDPEDIPILDNGFRPADLEGIEEFCSRNSIVQETIWPMHLEKAAKGYAR
jgi:hypothetical protein